MSCNDADEAIQVVAAVVVRSGAVLLCQRHDGHHLPLLWEFPGGKIETGELPPAALQRELDEELGVESTIGELVAEVVHRYADKTVCLRFFDATIIGTPRPHVHRQLRWVPIGRLHEFPVPPPNAVITGRLARGELAIH